MKFFPIGFDNFGELMERQPTGEHLYYFADKSWLIRDLLDCKDKVVLITRPRRFGKTTAMSMLEHFFNIINAERNKSLFLDLKIATGKTKRSGIEESCMSYQGRYPVIFITFKSAKGLTFVSTYGQVKSLIYELYGQHRYLLKSAKLETEHKAVFQRILEKTATDDEYNNAIKELCKYLQAHHGSKVMVLIDEYDAPFQAAVYHQYYPAIKEVMEKLVGEVLKNTGDFLEKAIVTGILRIAGAGIFSGANNVSVYTVLDERFSEYFGFEEKEVKGILADMETQGIADATQKFPEVSHWYNGYQFGKTVIYNPWSTMKCFSLEFDFSSHWLNTGSDALLQESFMKISEPAKLKITQLMKAERVEIAVYKELRFDGIADEDRRFWTLLLSAGYLKAVHTHKTEGQIACEVEIPNKEVKTTYVDVFIYWMQQILPHGENQILVEYLLTGEAEKFCHGLQRLLLECASVRDMRSDYIEAFYKGFLIATIGLSLGSHADLKSERESGLGYPDLVLRPRNLSNPKYQVGIVLELKRTDRSGELKIKAQEGLDQIKEKRYATEFGAYGISKVMLIGLAFCGKELEYVHEMLTVPENTPSVTALTRFGILRPRPVDGNEVPEEPETKRAKLG